VTDHGLGRVPSPPDARDHTLSQHVRNLPLVIATLPASVGVKPGTPILDQGQTPKCVAYSGALQRFVGERLDEHDSMLRFDAPELYARCKEKDGDPTGDGTYIRVAAKVLKDRGALILASGKPGRLGKPLPISAYAALTTVDEIKAAIYLFGSAWVGSDWPDNWFNVATTLPTPGKVVGGHAYSFVGYSDKRQAFRMQNNWGVNWAQAGRVWLPYRFVQFSSGLAFEAWRTIDVKGDTA
jgi:hypothetical protein